MSTPKTIGEKIAFWSYGKSDRANASENQSEGFQRGYHAAINRQPHTESSDAIFDEYRRVGSPDDPLTNDFKDWKRGWWAGVFQTINKP
jgi:hypothetical protein